MFGDELYSTHSSLFDLGCRVSILPCFMPDPTYLILNIHLIINTVQNIASLVVCVLIGNWCYDDLDDPLHRCQLGLLYDGLKIKLKRWKIGISDLENTGQTGAKTGPKIVFSGAPGRGVLRFLAQVYRRPVHFLGKIAFFTLFCQT